MEASLPYKRTLHKRIQKSALTRTYGTTRLHTLDATDGYITASASGIH